MIKQGLAIFIAILLALLCLNEVKAEAEVGVEAEKYTLITGGATKETKKLYQHLAEMQGRGVLFGHHYSNVFSYTEKSRVHSADWDQEVQNSDVNRSVSDFPAIFGFDFGQGFSNQLKTVKSAAAMGGIITFSDHMPNPLSPTSRYKHIDGVINSEISSVLPNGKHHNILVARLDSIADFANKATIDGRKIPIIYRPWHEHTGRWFWWGIESGTSEEYCELWRFTIEYLRDVKGVDNFIYAFSPSQYKEDYSYERRNPGSDFFDIAGLDFYSVRGEKEVETLVETIEVVVDYAQSHNKVPALTEFGFRGGIQNCDNPKWYTEEFLNPILESESARKITYALTWSNRGGQYWVPLKGHDMHDDFVEFYNSSYTFFLKDWEVVSK